jgi:hypothetical protein
MVDVRLVRDVGEVQKYCTGGGGAGIIRGAYITFCIVR